MKEQLIGILQERRQAAGNGTRPLGFGRFGESIGVDGTVIFRFCKNQRDLDIFTLRKLAGHAAAAADIEMIEALGLYALGVKIAPTMAIVDN